MDFLKERKVEEDWISEQTLKLLWILIIEELSRTAYKLGSLAQTNSNPEPKALLRSAVAV
jgi:hypothetical protein